MAFLEKLNKWQKLNLIVIALFLGGTITFLAFSKPSITGFVPATYSIKDLEVIILRDQSYFLNFEEEAKLKSVFISGKILGEGSVNIFLEANGKEYMIFSNELKNSGMDVITGFAIKEIENTDEIEADFVPEVEDILPDIDIEKKDAYSEELRAYVELLQKEAEDTESKRLFIEFIRNAEGYEFNEKCVDTCALFGLEGTNYRFIFDIDQGTTLLVDNIVYSIER